MTFFVLISLDTLLHQAHQCFFLTRSCFTRHIDAHQEQYIATLAEACAIKSVSAWADHRPEITKMVEWTKARCVCLAEASKKLEIVMQQFNCDIFHFY